MLSLGEMQRVSFARLLLSKRRYALLDEGIYHDKLSYCLLGLATSALDLKNESTMYELLHKSCPTFISIRYAAFLFLALLMLFSLSHRPSLQRFHHFVLEINDEKAQFIPTENYEFDKTVH